MNANELADNISLDNCHLDYADRLSIATMLRQKQELLNYASSNDRYQKIVIKEMEIQILKQQAEIEALKKKLNLNQKEK